MNIFRALFNSTKKSQLYLKAERVAAERRALWRAHDTLSSIKPGMRRRHAAWVLKRANYNIWQNGTKDTRNITYRLDKLIEEAELCRLPDAKVTEDFVTRVERVAQMTDGLIYTREVVACAA